MSLQTLSELCLQFFSMLDFPFSSNCASLKSVSIVFSLSARNRQSKMPDIVKQFLRLATLKRSWYRIFWNTLKLFSCSYWSIKLKKTAKKEMKVAGNASSHENKTKNKTAINISVNKPTKKTKKIRIFVNWYVLLHRYPSYVAIFTGGGYQLLMGYLIPKFTSFTLF